MNLAISALTERLTSLSRQELLQLPPQEAAQLDWFLKDQRCGQLALDAQENCPFLVAREDGGILFWLQNLTLTTDDHWEAKGTEYKAPFPKKSYLRYLFGFMLTGLVQPDRQSGHADRRFVPKSRDMLVSWSAMAFITWMCQWRHAFWICQSSKEDKAAELVRYARTLYFNQPAWLQARHPLENDTVLEMRWREGGRLLGLPGGVDQSRIYHPHGVMFDEAGFFAEFAECLDAFVPVVAQVIAVSTAAPGFFAEACAR